MPWRRKPDGRPFARIQRNGVRFQQTLLVEGESSGTHIPDDECDRRYQAWLDQLPEEGAATAGPARTSPRGHNPTIADFASWYTDTYLAGRGQETRTQARARLGYFARWADQQGIRRLSDLDSMRTAEFARDLGATGRAPNTVAGYIRYLKAAVNAWCGHAGIASPVLVWPSARHRQTQVVILRPEQATAFLEWVRTGRPRHYPVFLWLYRTAMRLGDTLALKWSSVDLEGRRVHVRLGKTGAALGIEIHQDALHALQLARHQHPEPQPSGSSLVFCTRKGRPFFPQTLQVLCREASKELGIRIHPHILRHTAAVELLATGAPVVAVQRFLGHATPAQTLNTYGQFAPGIESEYLHRLAQVAPQPLNGTPKP
jgi:integrase